MSELKKCPCCGHECVIETMQARKGWEAVIHCNGCLLSLHSITFDTEEEAITDAVSTWNRRSDHSGEVNGMMTLEEISASIQIICHNGGCPPDKDCEDKQDCHKCIMNWLACRQKPKEETE